MQSQKVAYILLHFPYPTETFVAEEIRAMRSLGVDVRIISLLGSGPGPMQPLSEQLLSFTWYAPGPLTYYFWRAQFHFIGKSPHFYLRLLADLLGQPYQTKILPSFFKRLMIFMKAIVVAYHLNKSNMQLLHSHFAWLSGAATSIIARFLELPFTVTVHAFDIFSHQNDLLRFVCQNANHVIAISKKNQQKIEALDVRPVHTISVIHCGINLAKINNTSFEEKERMADDPLRILSVGSLVHKKGHAYLIEACNLLQNQGQHYECSIVGNGPDKATLLQKIESYGLQKQVNILGALSHPEIMSLYRQYDIFVLASVIAPNGDRDGIPVVLMEAGACGLPLISTNVSGIPELVRHGQTGLVVPPDDPAALAKAINTIAIDTTLRKRLGQNARALVEGEYNSEINTLRLKTLFFETITKAKNLRNAT